MKKILIVLLFSFTLGFTSQKDNLQKTKKGITFFVGTSQGISFLDKEAKSLTHDKTFENTPGYMFHYFLGINLLAENKNSFSEITFGYNSFVNGIKNIVDVSSSSGFSKKTSYESYNYFNLGYRFSFYVRPIKEISSFLSLGIYANFLFSSSTTLNYQNGSKKINKKHENFSANLIITTSPTLVVSVGIDFPISIFGIKKISRISFDLGYDKFGFFLPLKSPSNQYFSLGFTYRFLF